MFSQNPLYYHTDFSHLVFGRRFDQALKYFNLKYSNSPNNETVKIKGLMRKIQTFFDILLKNFKRANSPT